jgi:Skp family chaperone for outer membrane proteins
VKTARLLAAIGAVATAALLLLPAGSPRAEDWFIPAQPHQASPAPRARAVRERPPARAERAQAVGMPEVGPTAAAAETQPPPPIKLPPIPQLPPLPRGPSPPAAVIGVLGVPEVMRASTAARQVEKVLGARREKLNQDARKEQAAWRDMQQSLGNERARLSADQIRNRERQLQERIANAQRVFRERNKIIQEAAQYALAQIERTLIAVIRQVSESRGMNLVLHRAQVALNVNEFDITKEVTDQLNKLLPAVDIPPDGKEPPLLASSTTAKPGEPGVSPAAESASAGGKSAQATPAAAETAEQPGGRQRAKR